MQTFLPYKDFVQSAKVLDRQRLGKQRVEGLQILHCLLGIGSKKWQHHPAVKMWRTHECVLAWYVMIVCEEWTSRGYKDSVREKVSQLITKYDLTSHIIFPPWLGNREFHCSHKCNLLRKDPAYYKKYFRKNNPRKPYVWPVK